MPAWVSILPPLVAIFLALAIRRVLIALVAGVWLGALMIVDLSPWSSVFKLYDLVVEAVIDPGHASILAFTLLLGVMIGLITNSGGGRGLALVVTRWAKSVKSGQLVTWVLGLVVFFDDYANSLLVGASMRPITDRLRISREKLAFIVDATAAPVASIALVSSWIGVEIGYIQDQFQTLGVERDAYMTFLQTIPFRFYPLLMIFFVFWVSYRGRDFGSMLTAERRARSTGEVLRKGSSPASRFDDTTATVASPHWINAVLPVVAIVVAAAVGMYVDGRAKALEAGLDPTLRAIFGEASSTRALLWAAGVGTVVAFLSVWTTRSLGFAKSVLAALGGMRAMALACGILVLAWALGAVCKELETAGFLIQLLGDWLSPALVPAMVFIVAALVSFATGTSWGAMAILFPLVVPLAFELAPESETVLLGTISSILAGSVWGDHCSPISDTTILSSLAASCDHVDHVRTQLPYALVVGAVSLVVGELAVGFELYPAWAGCVVGVVALVVIVELVGRPVDVPPPQPGVSPHLVDTEPSEPASS